MLALRIWALQVHGQDCEGDRQVKQVHMLHLARQMRLLAPAGAEAMGKQDGMGVRASGRLAGAE